MPSLPSDDVAAIDPEIQAELRDAFPSAKRRDLLAGFIGAVEAERDALAAAEGPAATADSAHRLASAAGMFGFVGLAAAARAIESDARAGRPRDAAASARLEAALAGLPAAVDALAQD